MSFDNNAHNKAYNAFNDIVNIIFLYQLNHLKCDGIFFHTKKWNSSAKKNDRGRKTGWMEDCENIIKWTRGVVLFENIVNNRHIDGACYHWEKAMKNESPQKWKLHLHKQQADVAAIVWDMPCNTQIQAITMFMPFHILTTVSHLTVKSSESVVICYVAMWKTLNWIE